VIFQLKAADDFPISAARRGERVRIWFAASGSMESVDAFDARGRICVALARGSTCWRVATANNQDIGLVLVREIPLRVLPKMVGHGHLTVSALLGGKVIGRRVFRVRP